MYDKLVILFPLHFTPKKWGKSEREGSSKTSVLPVCALNLHLIWPQMYKLSILFFLVLWCTLNSTQIAIQRCSSTTNFCNCDAKFASNIMLMHFYIPLAPLQNIDANEVPEIRIKVLDLECTNVSCSH